MSRMPAIGSTTHRPLPVRLNRRPTWPQPHHKFLVHPATTEVFSWRVVETKTNHIVFQHKNLRLALDKAERLNVEAAAAALLRKEREEVPRCGYQDDR